MGLRTLPFPSTPPPQTARIVVADPYPIISLGVQKILEDDPRFQVVAQASTMALLLKKMVVETPQVALIDWSMASQNLAATITMVRRIGRTTSIIFLTVPGSTPDKRLLMKSGACIFVSKGCSARRLRGVVAKACEGHLLPALLAPDKVCQTNEAARPEVGLQLQRLDRLTQRELQLLPLVCSGLKNREIALCLSIAETTVWHHLTAIFTKLQVEDRVGLVRFVYGHKLLDHDDLPERSSASSVPFGFSRRLDGTASAR